MQTPFATEKPIRRTAGEYDLAFKDYADALSIGPPVKNGYHDLGVVGISGAGARIFETVLKFDGSKYKSAACWLTDMSKDRKRKSECVASAIETERSMVDEGECREDASLESDASQR